MNNNTDKKALTFIMPFGKHKDKSILDISETDPKYILWLDKSNIYKFDAKIIQACESEILNADIDIYPNSEIE
jgi:uncharacterized protein (DUF3820 family)